LLKEQGSYNLVQNRGHKGPVLRPRCIGPKEGPYPDYYYILFYSLNADSDKLIAQTYNIAAVMSSENGSLQATIKQPNHMRILCTAVCINYI
jgi:hypothetical protein